MIDTTAVLSETNGFSLAPASRNKHLRLHRDDERLDLACRRHIRIERNPLGGKCGDLGRDVRIDHRDAARIEPARKPSGQHRAAHLAGTGEQDGAGDVLESVVARHSRCHKLSVVPAKAGTHNHNWF
ncbi:hypothetical protein ACVWXM_004902 [Bradyrhizobium sp. GM7.3]